MTHSAGASDFDFFMGRWHVHHRRLRERLIGSMEWEEWDGTSIAQPVLGGLGNSDEITLERPTGRTTGMTLRLYDPATQLWSLYWADSIHGLLQPPMVGRFAQGRGEFYNRETIGTASIISRFIWSDITPTTCRWEQAFSEDGGGSWEINWIMDFVRMP